MVKNVEFDSESKRELAGDENYLAFKKDEESGRFKNWGRICVLYVQGKLWAAKFDRQDLLDLAKEEAPGLGAFIGEVNAPRRKVDLGGANDVRPAGEDMPSQEDQEKLVGAILDSIIVNEEKKNSNNGEDPYEMDGQGENGGAPLPA